MRLGVGPKKAPQSYTVRPGDTLYSVAWQYGLDYHRVAEINRLDSSYQILPGQKLHLHAAKRVVKIVPQ